MSVVLGVNAVFHDPAAALLVDGEVVGAAEEERFNRRKHGKACVPFSTWEVPELAMRWVLEDAGLRAEDVDAVAYSYDPGLCDGFPGDVVRPGERASWDRWEEMRTMYVRRAEDFVRTALPGLRAPVVHVPHHVAHAASAFRVAPFDDCAVLVLDGRGEVSAHLSGVVRDGMLQTLVTQPLPDSIGLLYEEVTEHLGFRRSSDEFKVMALASHGDPDRFAEPFAQAVQVCPDGSYRAGRLDLDALAPRRRPDEPWGHVHADLAAAVQAATERVVLGLAEWLRATTGERNLAMAGGVALNCVANGKLAMSGMFDQVWIQPAAGDAGTALGAAAQVAWQMGDRVAPLRTPALGRHWDADQVRQVLEDADLVYERPDDLAATTAEVLEADGVVGWFEGRSEFGPRALGHRSLLVDPRREANLQRMNAVKGREEFRPVAPMILLERAHEIVDGPIPSPHMLFVHQVRPEWRDLIPAVVHVDGTARVQTVDRREEPLMAAVLDEFAARTGVPVLVNTSFNTAGRPMVDSPVDALECFGSGPVDLLVLAPFVVRRRSLA